MPASEIKFGGFSRLADELKEEIIEHAVANCIQHGKEHSCKSDSDLAKKSNSDLLKLARVNKHFKSSPSLKLALNATKWRIRATEAKSFKGLKACIQLVTKKTLIDREILKAAAKRSNSLCYKEGSAEFDRFSEDILEISASRNPEIAAEILAILCRIRTSNIQISSPNISAAMEYLNDDNCESNNDLLKSDVHLITRILYEEQKNHWDNLLPKICSYDKKHNSLESAAMMQGLFILPREEKLRRVCKVFAHMFNDASQVPSIWRDRFIHFIYHLDANDRLEACQRTLNITYEEWRSEWQASKVQRSGRVQSSTFPNLVSYSANLAFAA